MAVIKSKLKPSSAEFKAAVETMRSRVAELNDRLALARRGGGDDARNRHQGRGKLLPRERVAALLDPGTSFLELSPLAASCATPSSTRSAPVPMRSAAC